MFLNILQVSADEEMGKSSKLDDFFNSKTFFKFVLAWLAREKQDILTSQHITLMQTRLSANESARAILVIL